jgi:hypothetical protein
VTGASCLFLSPGFLAAASHFAPGLRRLGAAPAVCKLRYHHLVHGGHMNGSCEYFIGELNLSDFFSLE